MTSSMPGRSTLTATSRPSLSVAKCTCAMLALATGSASKLANSCSSGRPNARSIISRDCSAGNGGTRSCSKASSSATSSGSRSRRVDSTCPNLTKIGPSCSSARRSRTPRGSCQLRPRRVKRLSSWKRRRRSPDSARSSRPKRQTVHRMTSKRETNLMRCCRAKWATRAGPGPTACRAAHGRTARAGAPPAGRRCRPGRPRCPSAGCPSASAFRRQTRRRPVP
mmetsp:Transcript_59461/g.140704  ORF Transcript_59461/g.140704 Transcript_59461/m.140704 type:complete len:223 (+) Transcript_59461:730-1398(+)